MIFQVVTGTYLGPNGSQPDTISRQPLFGTTLMRCATHGIRRYMKLGAELGGAARNSASGT